jgi:tRNA(Ile)-lysidine synthase
MAESSPLALESMIAAAWPPERFCDLTVLVAVSGGPDSVALLRSLAAVRRPGPGRLVVGHYNHRLRGAASDEDAAFVRKLSRDLGLECEAGRSEGVVVPSAPAGPRTSEGALRGERYAFLLSLAHRIGARYVAVGHTADDQAETILHRICRGTGLRGLRGMPRFRTLGDGTTLVRPLLGVRRGEVLSYLSALGQAFRVDASNEGEQFTRNRIRRQVVPLLESNVHRGVVEALVRLGRLAGEAQETIEALAAEVLEACLLPADAGMALDCRKLATRPRYLVRELLRLAWRRQGWPEQAMDERQWERIAELALSPTGSRRELRLGSQPAIVVIERDGDRLRLVPT